MKYTNPHRNPLGLAVIFGMVCLAVLFVLVMIDYLVRLRAGG